MPELLICWHSRTGASEQLAKAAAEGAGPVGRLIRAADAQPGMFLDASGYLFVCPENLASMSGEMKEMFDRCYYPLLGKVEGRGYASLIAAGSDGTGAQRQLDRITTGWRLRRVAESIIVKFDAQTPETILAPKYVSALDLKKANELGEAMASGLEMGVF